MTSVSPIDLRRMLFDDAVSLALGGILLLIGTITLIVAVSMRRRAAALAWIPAFAYLYALRLVIRTATFRFYVEVPQTIWDYTTAAITYLVPIPIVLFARALFPAWRRFWTWGAIGLTIFAACAIASDAIRRHPFSASTPNNLIAIVFVVGVLVWILRRQPVPSLELQVMRVGSLAFTIGAVADNLRGIGLLKFRGPELEPFGFTVFIVCAGTIGVRRVLREGERLIAIRKEVDIARQIQASILPQSMPGIAGLTVEARYRPMTGVAGDFYDFLEVDSQRLGILVADVSGHGVPAALIASMVKMTLAAQRQHAESPAAVLAGMNGMLCGQLAGQYVTAAYLFLDTVAQVVRYGAAGHPPMLRAARGNGTIDEVKENGLILGFDGNQQYRELQDSLRPGDRFVLYTDGLIEASRADDLFGLDRLKATLAAAVRRDTPATAQDLLSAVDAWSGDRAGDDLTLVVADWSGGA